MAEGMPACLEGTLIYLAGSHGLPRRLVRVDRSGRVEPWSEHHFDFVQPALAGDGSRVAVALANSGELDGSIMEKGRPLPLRLSKGGDDYEPAWSPDGRRVIWNPGEKGTRSCIGGLPGASDQENQ